jgi:hypothetical protein
MLTWFIGMLFIPSDLMTLIQILFVKQLSCELSGINESIHEIFEPMISLLKCRTSKYTIGIEDENIRDHKLVRAHLFGA